MLVAAKMTSKGQITLPKELRRFLKAKAGSVIVFEKEDEKIIIRPTKTLLDYRGYLKDRKKPADFETLREKAKEYLVERVALGKRAK